MCQVSFASPVLHVTDVPSTRTAFVVFDVQADTVVGVVAATAAPPTVADTITMLPRTRIRFRSHLQHRLVAA
jgi:hypothetical protein